MELISIYNSQDCNIQCSKIEYSAHSDHTDHTDTKGDYSDYDED